MSNLRTTHDHLAQTLYKAIRTLVGGGNIKDRLSSAANILLTLHIDEIPNDLLPKYEELKATLVDGLKSAAGEGKIEATIRAMLDYDAEEAARRILDLYIDLKGGI